jgi:hypothetical protein
MYWFPYGLLGVSQMPLDSKKISIFKPDEVTQIGFFGQRRRKAFVKLSSQRVQLSKNEQACQR